MTNSIRPYPFSDKVEFFPFVLCFVQLLCSPSNCCDLSLYSNLMLVTQGLMTMQLKLAGDGNTNDPLLTKQKINETTSLSNLFLHHWLDRLSCQVGKDDFFKF